LASQVADNGVSDVIDMTGGSLLKEHQELSEELSGVNFVTPLFKRDSFDDVPVSGRRGGNQSADNEGKLILPGIVYPVCLTSYQLPLELGSFIFCANFLKMI
jgi:hypothetical protein